MTPKQLAREFRAKANKKSTFLPKALDLIVKKVKEEAPVLSGDLVRSTKPRIVNESTGVIEVGVHYGLIVHEGREIKGASSPAIKNRKPNRFMTRGFRRSSSGVRRLLKQSTKVKLK